MKMLISCFGTKIKPRKTIYILKGYTDSYSDLYNNLKISLYFFQMVVANLCKLQFFFANKFVCTVLTDLPTQFC